jgi:hypothetical protein
MEFRIEELDNEHLGLFCEIGQIDTLIASFEKENRHMVQALIDGYYYKWVQENI